MFHINSQRHLSSMQFILFAVAVLTQVVSSYKQEIEFYTEPNQQGNSITFGSSVSNLVDFEEIINNTKSYCVTGVWIAFDQVNYQIGSGIRFTSHNLHGERYCRNNTSIRGSKSLRHVAASDTSIPAISLYANPDWGGSEVYLERDAIDNILISVKSFATSGKSKWTFFSGPNFIGNKTCMHQVSSDHDIGFERMYEGIVYSVARGCDEETNNKVRVAKSRSNSKQDVVVMHPN